MTWNKLVIYRAIIVSTIGAMLWLMTTFQSKESFRDYAIAHDKWGMEVIANLRSDIGELKASCRRIEDRINEMNRNQKAMARDVRAITIAVGEDRP